MSRPPRDGLKVIGLMTARNEDWILGLTLRGVMLLVDEIIVLDHCSTDGTAAIVQEVAREHPGRVHYQRREDPVWREASIRQGLLQDGRRLGATHFWAIDADELVAGNILPKSAPSSPRSRPATSSPCRGLRFGAPSISAGATETPIGVPSAPFMVSAIIPRSTLPRPRGVPTATSTPARQALPGRRTPAGRATASGA